MPLILNFHGGGRNDVFQADYSQLEEKGPARGFVVITPNAGDQAFWGKRELSSFEASDANFAVTRALIDNAEASLCIDTHRVYATGFSEGAAMSAYLECKLNPQYRSRNAHTRAPPLLGSLESGNGRSLGSAFGPARISDA